MKVYLDPDLVSEEKKTAYLNERVRMERDILLFQSDWTQMTDSPLSNSKKAEWATYRQQLRDFPATWTPAETVTFPDQPT